MRFRLDSILGCRSSELFRVMGGEIDGRERASRVEMKGFLVFFLRVLGGLLEGFIRGVV